MATFSPKTFRPEVAEIRSGGHSMHAAGNIALQRLMARSETERTPGPVAPTPAPAPAPTPAPVGPECHIDTYVVDHAPDGSPNNRTTVGVNEQVSLNCHTPAVWTSPCFTFSNTASEGVLWRAPETPGSCLITATPTKGSPCSVTFDVVAPDHRELTAFQNTPYDPGLAGSGFIATVKILPLNVAFFETEFMEDSAVGVATGYYDTVLNWNGRVHPPTKWDHPDNRNMMQDTIGMRSPGTPGPFSEGDFTWSIPQLYRLKGSAGTGAQFSKAEHLQHMFGKSGTEMTDKEGGIRARRP